MSLGILYRCSIFLGFYLLKYLDMDPDPDWIQIQQSLNPDADLRLPIRTRNTENNLKLRLIKPPMTISTLKRPQYLVCMVPGWIAEHEESADERHAERYEEARPPRAHPVRGSRRQVWQQGFLLFNRILCRRSSPIGPLPELKSRSVWMERSSPPITYPMAGPDIDIF